MRSQCAATRALCHEPAILLADEPTGNLDDDSAAAVLALLDRLVRQAGRTMLIATHSASIAAHCDRVVELQHGRLAGSAAAT
jgi:putative ABC transport system ATP-binding protein